MNPAETAGFPRTARLLKPIEFKRVFKNSTASSDRYFKILARPNGRGGSRLGMAVSRQVDKRAVGRNRIKRVIRESFRHSFEGSLEYLTESAGTAQPGAGLDLVVLPRHVCATICNRQLANSLEAHWSRLGKALKQKRMPAETQTLAPGSSRVENTAGRQ